MKKRAALCLSALVSISLCFADNVNIASEVSFPPWNDTSKDGKYVGYEVDLFPKICEKAKLSCNLNGQDFATIIPSVRFKKYDVIMSGMMITPNRLRVIDFSVPYGKMPTVFAIKKGGAKFFCKDCKKKLDLNDPADNQALIKEIEKTLVGKKIVVQTNSINHIYFTENKKLTRKLNIVTAPTSGDMVKMLENGEADIAFSTKTYIVDSIKNKKQVEIIGPDIEGGLIGKGVGIGVRKTDKELKQKLDNAIKALKDEGVLSELSQKWFGFDMFPK